MGLKRRTLCGCERCNNRRESIKRFTIQILNTATVIAVTLGTLSLLTGYYQNAETVFQSSKFLSIYCLGSLLIEFIMTILDFANLLFMGNNNRPPPPPPPQNEFSHMDQLQVLRRRGHNNFRARNERRNVYGVIDEDEH